MSVASREPSSCRLLIDPPASGAWQMAVDEVLLESAAHHGIASLRFYRWSEPTLSLGYFQSAAERAAHRDSRQCPLVRRQTGGGAILHDQELTYSLAVPVAHPLAADASRLYRAVHEALVGVLGQESIPARISNQGSQLPPSGQPFLCFQRRTAGDVLVHEAKICGSAQRRRRGAILQHGSLLLARSLCAPELPGIQELCGHKLLHQPFTEAAAPAIAAHLGLRLEPKALTADELNAVRTLAIGKYFLASWNERR